MRKGGPGRERDGMPRLRKTGGPAGPVSDRPGGGRFTGRARVIAGGVAALAVLAVLAAAALVGSGGPAPVRMASVGTRATTGSGGTGTSGPAGAQTYSGNTNPNPSAHPNTITGPAAPPVASM